MSEYFSGNRCFVPIIHFSFDLSRTKLFMYEQMFPILFRSFDYFNTSITFLGFLDRMTHIDFENKTSTEKHKCLCLSFGKKSRYYLYTKIA